MKIVIKHKLLAAVAENLQVVNDILSDVTGQERIDVIAASQEDLAKKKSRSSRAVKIVNDPFGETLTVILNDDVLVKTLEAQGDLLEAVKLYIERIKKGSF